MSQLTSTLKVINQLVSVLPLHRRAYHFARENRVWRGLFEIKWVVILGLVLSAIISLKFISVFIDWFDQINNDQTQVTAFQSASMLAGNITEFGTELFISGSYKYMILIFVEIIIFYCVVNTLNILRNRNFRPQFNDFIKAQKRMIHVSVRAWILEITISFIIGTLLSVVGFSILKSPTILLIQFYFIGVVFLDNYTEQFGLTIKDSLAIINSHTGAAVGIGMVAHILFLVPLLGIVLAPILGGITAALYMNSQEINLDSDILDSLEEGNYEFV